MNVKQRRQAMTLPFVPSLDTIYLERLSSSPLSLLLAYLIIAQPAFCCQNQFGDGRFMYPRFSFLNSNLSNFSCYFCYFGHAHFLYFYVFQL